MDVRGFSADETEEPFLLGSCQSILVPGGVQLFAVVGKPPIAIWDLPHSWLGVVVLVLLDSVFGWFVMYTMISKPIQVFEVVGPAQDTPNRSSRPK